MYITLFLTLLLFYDINHVVGFYFFNILYKRSEDRLLSLAHSAIETPELEKLFLTYLIVLTIHKIHFECL